MKLSRDGTYFLLSVVIELHAFALVIDFRSGCEKCVWGGSFVRLPLEGNPGA